MATCEAKDTRDRKGVRTALRNLARSRTWVDQQTERSTEGGRHAQNIMVGCVQVINSCGQSIRDWIDREEDRRNLLERIQKIYPTRRGKRVLLKLIDLAIVMLEACTWVDTVMADALPAEREPRPKRKLSDAHKQAMAAGYHRAQERRRETRESRLRRR